MIAALLAILLPTFGVMGIGYFARTAKIWENSAVEVLNRYAYYLALPALIFESVKNLKLEGAQGRDDIVLFVGTLLAHLLVLAVVTIATLLTPKTSRETRATFPIITAFGATAYLGIPYATYAFGEQGTAYASILSVILVVSLIFTSIFFLNRYGNPRSHETSLRRVIELPFLWAVLLGLLWPILRLPDLPLYLNKLIAVLSGSASPTALLAFGAFLYNIKLHDLPWIKGFLASLIKTLGTGLVTFLLLRLLGLDGLRLAVGTSISVVPVALTASVLAGEYRTGQKLVATAIAFSTILSMLALTIISTLYLSTSLFQ